MSETVFDATALRNALANVEPHAEHNGTLPVLGAVRMECDGSTLELIATEPSRSTPPRSWPARLMSAAGNPARTAALHLGRDAGRTAQAISIAKPCVVALLLGVALPRWT